MEIYKKIRNAIIFIKNSELKKVGYNDYSKYYYYTPEQVSKLVYDACIEFKLFVKFDLFSNEFGIFGQMSIIDIEDPNEYVNYNMSTDIPQITATNSTQQLGGAMTYTKRYMLMNIFDIVDNTLDFDTPQKTKITTPTNKKDPEKWLNVYKSKEKTEYSKEFINAWDAIHSKGLKITDIRKEYKVSKETALLLEDPNLKNLKV